MPMLTTSSSKIFRVLATAALTLSVVGVASAAGYDFGKQVSGGGGGGGADPEKRRIVSSRGANICLDISEVPGNQVRFTIWSEIPEPNARLASINIDTGLHRDLFTGITVVLQSLGVKSNVVNPGRDASSRTSSVRYIVQLPYEYPQGGGKGFNVRGGLAPGNFIVMSANLGPGKTFANVINALNQGFNPASEVSGLRIWVTGHNFLGGPPPGVGTINDDATFMVRGLSPRCQRR